MTKVLDQIEESFFVFYNAQKEVEPDLYYFLGYLFKLFIDSKQDLDGIEIDKQLDLILKIIKEIGLDYNVESYVTEDLKGIINVSVSSEFILFNRDLFNSLTNEEKLAYWEFSVRKNCVLLTEHLVFRSIDLNLRELFIKGIKERWIKPIVIKFFSRIFLMKLLNYLMNKEAKRASILIKKIEIPNINSIPSGIIELNKINIFIGQNNQGKSRFLRFIKVILLALGDLYEFSQRFNGKRFSENYCDDQEIKEIFEEGFKIVIEIRDFIQTDEKKIKWGWEFPKYKERILNCELEFHNGFSKLTSIDSNFDTKPDKSQIEQILRSNIKEIYLDELSTINKDEQFPKGGWEQFDEDEKVKDFTNNFRKLLSYNKWLITEHYQNFELLPNKIFDSPIPSANFIKEIKESITKWRIISKLFFFSDNYEEFFDTKDITHYPTWIRYIDQLKIAMNILNTYKLYFNIKFDEGKNLFKLARDNASTEGEDILKQGHGIRTIALTFLSSVFCNFILMDEPENGLHISLQRGLSNYLSKSFNNQIFIVTHSPSLIPHNDVARVFLIHKRRISYKQLSPEKWGDHEHFINRNIDLIKRIIGIRPEDLLFEKAVIYFEGRTDISFYSDLFLDYGIKLDRVNGVSNLKQSWKTYRDFLGRNLNENLIFLFDRDYFNEIIAETDDLNAFTLPCYSFENLLLDPYFLSQEIFKIPLEKVNQKLLELLDDEKVKTLDFLFLAHLYRTLEGENVENSKKIIKEDKNINWCSIDMDDLQDQLYCCWSIDKKEISKEDVIASGLYIKEICQNWKKDYVYHIKLKEKANSLVEEIYNSCLTDEQKKNLPIPSLQFLKKKYLEFIKDNVPENLPDCLTRDFIIWLDKVKSRLNL